MYIWRIYPQDINPLNNTCKAIHKTCYTELKCLGEGNHCPSSSDCTFHIPVLPENVNLGSGTCVLKDITL